MPAPVLTFRVIDNSDDLLALRPAWASLWQSLPRPPFFSSFQWCWNAWDLVARGRGYALRVVVGELDGRVVLILPLMQVDGVLRLLSSETVEYRDALVADCGHAAGWIDQAWDFARTEICADLFLMQNLRAPNHLAEMLARQAGLPPIIEGSCPIIRLDRCGDWDTYAKGLPRSMASDQRRQWRRIHAVFPGLQFRVADSVDEVLRLLDWITRHKQHWAEARRDTSVWFASQEKRALLEAVVRDSLANGTLVFAALGEGQTTISAGWGYVSGDEFLFNAFAYDAAYGTYSPSRLFIEQLVRHCFERGLRVFDFMPGGQSYKRHWATEYVPELTYGGALTARGRRLLRLAALKRTVARRMAAMRLYHRLPAGLRDWVQGRSRAFQLVDYVVNRHAAAAQGSPTTTAAD